VIFIENDRSFQEFPNVRPRQTSDDVSEIKIDLKIDIDMQCSKFPAYSITSSARSLRRSQKGH
jgi:hypothetical protein